MQKTFYRTPEAVRRFLALGGLEAEFVDVAAWRPGRRLVQRLLSLDSSSWLIRTWYMNYGGNLGLATFCAPTALLREKVDAGES